MIESIGISRLLSVLAASVLVMGVAGGAAAQTDQKILATEAFSPAAG